MDTAINVDAVVISEVVFKARLPVELSEATDFEAENGAFARPLLWETGDMAVLETWAESVEAEAATQGFSNM